MFYFTQRFTKSFEAGVIFARHGYFWSAEQPPQLIINRGGYYKLTVMVNN
jgi:hypothetical protein